MGVWKLAWRLRNPLPMASRKITKTVAKKKLGRKRARPEEPPGSSRAGLIEAYLPLVRFMADRIGRRLPLGMEREPLVNSGVVGLLEAVDRYDQARGVPFDSYARHRIHGEMIECLRSMDWASRSVRAWVRKIRTARTRLTAKLCRRATAEELAAELGVSLDEYYRIEHRVSTAKLIRLDSLSVCSSAEVEEVRERFGWEPRTNPMSLVERKNLIQKLIPAVHALPERERLIVTLYYYEELTMRKIGQLMNLSEGRISQIYGQALSRLRLALAADGDASQTHSKAGNTAAR